MAVAVITVEGVIRALTGSRVIPEGARLYKALKAAGPVYLISVNSSENQLRDWFELEGLPFPDMFFEDYEPLSTVARGRSRGIDIDLVVDADPAVIAALQDMGVNTLLFTHSQFAHPEWRPNKPGLTAWESMVNRINADIRAKAADKRLQDEE